MAHPSTTPLILWTDGKPYLTSGLREIGQFLILASDVFGDVVEVEVLEIYPKPLLEAQ